MGDKNKTPPPKQERDPYKNCSRCNRPGCKGECQDFRPSDFDDDSSNIHGGDSNH